jgi:hypothetical protein
MNESGFSSANSILRDLEIIKAENEILARELELQLILQPIDPFPSTQCTPEATRRRVRKSSIDFWYFDRTYFPADMYQDYAKPGKIHREMVKIAELNDGKAHIIAGSRKIAKTGTFKKFLVWMFLFGKRRYIGFGSSTLSPATDGVRDIRNFLMSNPRILHDYNLLWAETSEERLFAKSEVNPKGTFMDALSEERSTRGRQRNFFLRYEIIFVTDFENETSSMTPDAVHNRIDRLNEMRTSLSDRGVLIWEGNNFDTHCAMNQLITENEKGVLSDNFAIHLIPAWDENRNPKSAWPEKYPAKSEAEMKALMKPKDAHDWDGNFQQRPSLESGDIFPRKHYHEYDQLPADVRAVIYCDPNLALKSQGDNTAITGYGWSYSTQKYYIILPFIKSFADSNELLDELLKLRQKAMKIVSVICLGFDGNVTQESTWTNNVNNYSRLKHVPMPRIEYRRYKVDDLTKNIQAEWAADNILFPKGFAETQTGKIYLQQVFGFRGKKANRPDDAPDTMICAHELLIEEGIGGALSGKVEFYSVSNRHIKGRF